MSRGHPEVRLKDQIRALFQAGSLGGLPDGQLLDRYASSDRESSEAAFGALVERHGAMVLGVCRRMLDDTHLAEDAFQATFLVLARRAKSVRNRDSLGGWLHRVAHRIAMRLRRRVDLRKSREMPAPGAVEVAVKHSDRVEHDELRAQIDHEIDRLFDAQRLPVVLCCLQGVSHEEASQRLHWPLGTLKSRLARGKKRLQERLIRKGFAPAAALAVGSSLFATDTSAAVPPALFDATTKAAAAIAAGGAITGVVPAALSVLVREELTFMLATKLKLAVAASLAAGASAVLIGFVIAASPTPAPEKNRTGAALATAGEKPEVQAEAPPPSAKLSAKGTVVDSTGKPIAGARVILREWSVFRIRGMPHAQSRKIIQGEWINDTLKETTTDAAGQFAFQDVTAPAFPQIAEVGQSVFPWDVVAIAPAHGLAWVPLTPQNQRTPVTLKLGAEGTLHGRVVEPGGNPVLGAKVQVFGIDPLGRPDENGLGTVNRLNLSWSAFPLGATTNADGRFTVAGLPRDKVISLAITQPRHERLFAFAATSEQPQPDFVSPTSRNGKPEEARMPVYTGDFTLTSKVADHVLIGQVVRDADGKPAAKAQVIHQGTAITTDLDGRFRIEGLVAGKLELNAAPDVSDSETAPAGALVEIPQNPKEIEHTLKLPRGLILSGKVVDDASGAGVEKALVDFTPLPGPDQAPIQFGFSKETDANGRFRLVVPPGRGTLILRTFPLAFPQPERSYTGQPDNSKFARNVDGRAGQTVEVPEFKLTKGREVVLRVVDSNGRPLLGARIDVRDPNRMFNNTSGRSDALGRYTLFGLALDQSMIVDIIDAKGSVGATIEVPDATSAGPNGGELEVRLQPLLALSGRALDALGKPLSGALIHLYRNVIYPGQSARSFGVPVGTLNKLENDGTYTFNQLIAGATYNTQIEVSGYPNATSNHVIVKPGPPTRLDDFRLPAVDQEVSGVVVDPRGKPLAGVSVSLQRNGPTSNLYAPAGGVWFQDTDEAGRFHLTSLPRGPKRLMVYRNPTAPHQQIEGIKYADVRAGEANVRIELPDANNRLRGVD